MIFKDQCGNSIVIDRPPQRIISLVPSQTELLYDLNLEERVVGITRYCVHPTHWADTKAIVGGTKKIDHSRIEHLSPDLIIGNMEENAQEDILALKKRWPVWLSDVRQLAQAMEMIRCVGKLTQTEATAASIIDHIERGFDGLVPVHPLRTLYLIWRKPWMAVAGDTFIDAMLVRLGLVNCMADRERYPEITPDQISSLSPELILLPSEPFPFSVVHADELKEIVPAARIMKVDGEMFSWYGSRMRLAASYFNSLPLPRL